MPKIIHSAKNYLPNVKKNTRQTLIFAECQKIIHSAKNCLPCVFILPSVFCMTLGKDLICRVYEKIHSAKGWALSKHRVSRSDSKIRWVHRDRLQLSHRRSQLMPFDNGLLPTVRCYVSSYRRQLQLLDTMIQNLLEDPRVLQTDIDMPPEEIA